MRIIIFLSLFIASYSQISDKQIIKNILDTMRYENTQFDKFKYPKKVPKLTIQFFHERYKRLGIPINTKLAFQKGIDDAISNYKNGKYEYVLNGSHEDLRLVSRNGFTINKDSLFCAILKSEFSIVYKNTYFGFFSNDPAHAYYHTLRIISNALIENKFGINFLLIIRDKTEKALETQFNSKL